MIEYQQSTNRDENSRDLLQQETDYPGPWFGPPWPSLSVFDVVFGLCDPLWNFLSCVSCESCVMSVMLLTCPLLCPCR